MTDEQRVAAIKERADRFRKWSQSDYSHAISAALRLCEDVPFLVALVERLLEQKKAVEWASPEFIAYLKDEYPQMWYDLDEIYCEFEAQRDEQSGRETT